MSIPTIGRAFRAARERHPDRIALVDGDEELTYAELQRRVERVGRYLMSSKVAAGDRVVLWMRSCTDWVVVALAVMDIGAVLVPVNLGLTVREAAEIVARAEPVLLVVAARHGTRQLAGDAASVHAAAAPGARLVIVDDPAIPAAGVLIDQLTADDFPDATYRQRLEDVRPELPCLLLYSSGTTGRPKGVLHSHRLAANMSHAAHRMAITESDTLVLYLPLFHVFGAAAVITFLHVGARIVLLSHFDAAASLDRIEDVGATVVYGVGTMYYDQLKTAGMDRRDLSTVRVCMASGPPKLLREVEERMGPALNVWGMTETSGISTLPELSDPAETRTDTMGRPLPGVEVRVLGDDGQPLPPDHRGRLEVRGIGMMLGYFRDQDLTDRVVNPDGWFRTGDLALVRPDGGLVFLGRGDDAMRVGGEQVDAVEIEEVLMTHPAIAAAAVVATTHDRLGQVPVAFVQVVPGQPSDPGEFVLHARRLLASYKVPRTIHVVDVLPRTGSGKLRKDVLREAAARPESRW